MQVSNQPSHNLTDFTEQLNSKKKTDAASKLAQLRGDSGLRELLPHLIAHLADSSDKLKLKDAEHIAHFLMGRRSELPLAVQNIKDKNGRAYVISSETKKILADVLSPHHYLFTEDDTKILAKLQQIDDGLKKLDNGSKLLFAQNVNQSQSNVVEKGITQSVEETKKNSIDAESIEFEQDAVKQSQLLEPIDQNQPQPSLEKIKGSNVRDNSSLINKFSSLQSQQFSRTYLDHNFLNIYLEDIEQIKRFNLNEQNQLKQAKIKEKLLKESQAKKTELQRAELKKSQLKQDDLHQERKQSQVKKIELKQQLKKSQLKQEDLKQQFQQGLLVQ